MVCCISRNTINLQSRIQLFDVYSEGIKTHSHKNTVTQMLLMALCTKVKNLETSQGWVNQINKLWHVHTMNYYLSIKNEWVTDKCKNMNNLKRIMLNERIQTQKPTYCEYFEREQNMCHPNIGLYAFRTCRSNIRHFGTLMILSYRHLNNNKCRERLSLNSV